MRKNLEKLLRDSENIHIPIPIDKRETAEARLTQKPVLKSRLLDDMSSLDNWVLVDTYSTSKPEHLTDPNDSTDRALITPRPQMELSTERFVSGDRSLKFTHPTNLPQHNPFMPGRIYAMPAVKRVFPREDWRDYNRLSVWIYPVAPGIKSLTLRMQLYNDGQRKVPDFWGRDGHHNFSLEPDQWNHVVLEFPYLDRDKVVGLAFEYDMVGHEPDAVDEVTWYIDQLELQEVECDVYEGWLPAADRISFSHEGYQPGGVKLALAHNLQANSFKLIETATGRVVLEKQIETEDTLVGRLQIMDFTEVMDEGEYLIIAGDLSTRVFSISHDVWEVSVWKVLNFFLVQRCGYEVPGKHRACHSDVRMVMGDKAIIANGGWHDAADLAQGLYNTAEATMALLSLAKTLKDSENQRLYKRVLEEAKWGLDYVLKMRFPGGWRGTYISSSIWTDGVIGTSDDIVMHPARSAYINFDAAYALALGAELFTEIDQDYARYCLKIAEDDFHWGLDIFSELPSPAEMVYEPGNDTVNASDKIQLQVVGIGALGAAKLYELTQKPSYETAAKDFTAIIIGCQEQNWMDWDVPMTGFFYQDVARDLIWHHAHMAYSQLPELALLSMCKTFPHDQDYMQWYGALTLSAYYYKTLAQFTYPYSVIPAGVYHEDEADLGFKTFASHIWAGPQLAENYKMQVRQGFPIGQGYYVRVYPVWFSFRGNYNVLLSQNKAMTCAAAITNDYELYCASQHNYEWIIGKNPMAQSTTVGVGYDFAQHYAVQPGQTTGSMVVGMQSHDEKDEPYWPQVSTATYKEVWICPPTKWMWGMADSLLPATVEGCLTVKPEANVVFTHQKTGRTFSAAPHPRTGYFQLNLPAGYYTVTYGSDQCQLIVISGSKYILDGSLYQLEAHAKRKENEIILQITAKSEKPLSLSIKAFNVSGLDQETVVHKTPLTLRGNIIDETKPYAGLIIPEGNFTAKVEFKDERLRK